MHPPRSQGLVILVLGVVAWVRSWVLAGAPCDPADVGEPIRLEIEALQGDAFRLLPGVGPALAERLERARQAAGGRLEAEDLAAVPGVGPARVRRWATLRSR